MLMTGKVTYRVDAYEVELLTRPEPGSDYNAPMKKTGKKSADLEITIDLDELRTLLARDAMHNDSCKITRLQRTIVVRPVKGTLKVEGSGQPW